MRTEEFRDFDKRLSAINKNFSHDLFFSEQFMIDNSELIRSNPEALSEEVYTNNSYSKNFNYRLKDVPGIIKDYQNSSSISYYILIYSAFDLYIENLFNLVDDILEREWQRPEKISTLEAIFLYLDSLITDELEMEEVVTLDYIRLRRNSLVHAEGKPSSKLRNIIKNNGQSLTLYWRGALVKLNTVDFSLMEIDQFRFWEIIDIILILRAIAKKIDQKVLNLLKLENILDYVRRGFQADFAKAIREKSEVRVQNIFTSVAKRKFNINKEDINFETLAL